MKTARPIAMLAAALAPLACDATSPTVPPSRATLAADAPVEMAMGMHQASIGGTIQALADFAPARAHATPSGMCRYWDLGGVGEYDGDVQGQVTWHRYVNIPCDGGHLRGAGPVEGTFTWNGRTGPVSGQWTTNCKADDSPAGMSCDGTMNFRGSGDLEGVQFHMKWGPGWWPFSWTGTVFWK